MLSREKKSRLLGTIEFIFRFNFLLVLPLEYLGTEKEESFLHLNMSPPQPK